MQEYAVEGDRVEAEEVVGGGCEQEVAVVVGAEGCGGDGGRGGGGEGRWKGGGWGG